MRQSCWSMLIMLAVPAALACAGSAPQGTPAPSPRSSPTPVPAATPPPADSSATLVGHWSFMALVAGEQYSGTLDLSKDPVSGWKAKLVEQTMGDVPVTSLTVEGATVKLGVDAGGAPALIVGSLQPDGTLEGRVEVEGGQGSFSARKG